MARVVKAALATLLVFALVWTAVIVHWQATARQPSGADIVLSLVLLPIALAALLFASIRAFKRARMPAASAPAGSAAAQPSSGHAAGPDSPRAPLAIVASAIIGAACNTSAELAAAFADGKPPALDTELRDRDGFPVFAARAVIDSALIEEWRASLAGRRDAFAPIAAIDDEVLRTLALASMALDALLHELATLPNFVLVSDMGDEAEYRKPQRAAPRWFVTLLLPPEWTDALRSAASELFGARVEAGLAELGLHAGAREISAPLVRLGVETMTLIDSLEARLAADTQRGMAPGIALIVAAASHIGESTIDAWQSRGTLFGAATPQGLVPGECAAGLVMTPASLASQQVGENATHPPLFAAAKRVHLHRVASGRRETPVDARGKASADALATVADRALLAAGPAAPAQPLSPDQVACIVADSGPQAVHLLELAALVSERFPDLDPLADNWALGSIQGHIGVAGTLAALCVAHACAIAREAPVLVASTSDRFERAAAVLTIAA